MLKASYKKSGYNFLPVVLNTKTGEKRVLWGEPLVSISTAKKYAQIHINKINSYKAK